MRPHVLTDTDVVCWTKIKCRFPALKDSFYIQAFKPLRCHHTRASCIIQNAFNVQSSEKYLIDIYCVLKNRTRYIYYYIIGPVTVEKTTRLQGDKIDIELPRRVLYSSLAEKLHLFTTTDFVRSNQTWEILKFSNVGGGKEIEIISPYILFKKWKFAHQKQL